MSGLVSVEYDYSQLERVAGDEAYTNFTAQEFEFAPDGDDWRFFTGQTKIRFFGSHLKEEWELKCDFRPVQQGEEVAAYLQEEFDRFSA